MGKLHTAIDIDIRTTVTEEVGTIQMASKARNLIVHVIIHSKLQKNPSKYQSCKQYTETKIIGSRL